MEKKITLPITEEAIADLKAGDSVLLTGTRTSGCLSLSKKASRCP